MILSILLVALLAVLIYKGYKDYYQGEVWYAVAVIVALVLIPNLVILSRVHVSFDIWVAEREALVQTIESESETASDLEMFELSKQVIVYNQELANRKVENKSWLWRNYIDDRVEYLEPIKINRFKKQTE